MEEDTLNDRGIYKDSKWPWLFEQLESWAENNSYLRTPVLKYLFVPGSYLWLYLALAAVLVIVDRKRFCLPLSLWQAITDHVVRAHRTDAICISGDAGAALCTGACHRQEEKWIN